MVKNYENYAALCLPTSATARAAAELETLRRDFPPFAIERCLSPDGALTYYSATRRAGEWSAHPYHVTRNDLGELRRELAAGESHRGPA